MTRTNPLWDVIQAYMDDPKHRYPPKPADLARETGVSEQVLSKWKSKPTLPSPSQLAKIASGTGIRYEKLLGAALVGRYYMPGYEEVALAFIHIPTRTPITVPDRWLSAVAGLNANDSSGSMRDLYSLLRASLSERIGGDGNADTDGGSAPMKEGRLSEAAPSLRSVANKGDVEPEDGALTDP